MRVSVFITTSRLGYGTGGGCVSLNELQALKEVSDLRQVLSYQDLNPANYGLPDNPFLVDYLACHLVVNIDFDIAVFNGNPFGLTAEKLKPAKIIVDVPAHNVELSMSEFYRLGLPYNYPHLTNQFLWRLYTAHIKMADTVICPSKTSADYIAEKLGLDNVVVIPHGCNPPKEIPPYPDTFTVGHLGVNGPDKGQVYLVTAWRRLNIDGRLLIAGFGTKVWGGLGYVKDPSIVYANCTVYVQPSVTEAFGIPCLEAMSYGRPVIATEGAGVHELIEDGKEGFIVPIRNSHAIAEKILYFYDNPSEVKRMGRNARLKALNYTWDKIREHYKEVYLS